jgi:hypothetical protein
MSFTDTAPRCAPARVRFWCCCCCCCPAPPRHGCPGPPATSGFPPPGAPAFPPPPVAEARLPVELEGDRSLFFDPDGGTAPPPPPPPPSAVPPRLGEVLALPNDDPPTSDGGTPSLVEELPPSS